jgi:hypothetical protein
MLRPILLCLAVLAAALPARAAGVTDLWALDAKGEPAKVGNFQAKTRIYTAEELARQPSAFRAGYPHKVTFCNVEFLVSSAQKRWIAAHRKAGNRIVLRERRPQNKFHNVC